MTMKSPEAPKLPAEQLAILAVARFAEPLAMTSVFPYLPEMIASFGVDQDSVALWAGITGAVFSLTQSFTAVLWGRASDHFGRKPVIITSLMLTMVGFLVWGMSTNLAMAVTIRAIQGASNGNVGIIRTMVAEMVPEKVLQPVAFSIMPLVWSVGSIFGPAFGGFFANPVERFPSLFGNSTFFKAFPYALPNIMASIIFLSSMTTAFLFLKETLVTKRDSRDRGIVLGQRLTTLVRRYNGISRLSRPSNSSNDEESAPLLQAHRPTSKVAATETTTVKKIKNEKAERPTLAAVFSNQTILCLICYTFLAFHAVAYDQVLPVFLHHKREEHTPENTSLPFVFGGGFGLKSDSIGTIFTLYGVLSGVLQFIVYPPIATRLGVLNCFKMASVVMPIAYFLTPYTTLIEDPRTKFGALLAIMALKSFANIFGFPSLTILMTNSASSLSILGTLNGFATTFSGIGRALGPSTSGLLFTLGATHGVIGLPMWALATVAAIGAVPGWWLIEGEGPSGSQQQQSSSDEIEEEEAEPSVISPALHITARPEAQDDEHQLFSKSAKSTSSGYGTVMAARP